jgi:cytochrome c biogenesis protein
MDNNIINGAGLMEANKISNLISHRLAIGVISALFAATLFGWLLGEVFPPDFQLELEKYSVEWGETSVKLSIFLRLYDPFHSFWYTSVLLLFFVVLLLCIVSRAKQFIKRSLIVSPPGDRELVLRGNEKRVVEWLDPLGKGEEARDPLVHFTREQENTGIIDDEGLVEMTGIVMNLFKNRKYRIASEIRPDLVLFRAVSGRWRFLGNLVFHAGLLLITAGGMIGSLMGDSAFYQGGRGDIIPLPGSSVFLRVDEFRIIMGLDGMISDYISTLSIIDSTGAVIKAGEIEVNKPMKHGPVNIYQSSYSIGEGYKWVDIEYKEGGSNLSRDLRLGQGEKGLLSDSVWSIIPGRFFSDFRMGSEGPYSASTMMVNPAVMVHVVSSADTVSGYLFLRYPQFNTKFGNEILLSVKDIEPEYLTGLEVSVNPGSGPMLAGMFLSAVGLLLLYAINFRSISGFLDRERLVISMGKMKMVVSARAEIRVIERQIRERVARLNGDGTDK